MNVKWKIFFASVGFIFVMVALVGFYYFTETRMDMSTVEYIQSMQSSPNEFLDLANDINVSSAADLGYIVEGNYSINIMYGDQIIRMTKKCFESKEYRQEIAKIGLKVYVHVDENDPENILYRVTYWDDPVEELSRIN